MDELLTVLKFAGIPTAITGLFFWLIQRKITNAEKKREQREQLREKQELFLVQGVNAAIALGEATAKAVQRIPDAHCNGDMHAALDYASKVKHKHREFLEEQGVHALY
ncbi:MAG: hypothetical protein J6Q59_04055 [Paludibacteraceae bacterium]|nr:hypothetical protein [Paludibacteraceae bacterium]